MGLYDTIICDYPITSGLPDWVKKHPFQTKDLECSMSQYYIAIDGSFSESQWTGMLNYYTSNVVGSGAGIYTSNGEDAEYLDCTAKIVDGKLAGEIQVERSSHRAWHINKMHIGRKPSKEEVEQMAARRSESMVGKGLYVLWGGQEIGYWIKVIAENDRQLVTQHEHDTKYHQAGYIELIDRFHRDHIFWDSDKEALDVKRKKQAEWDRQREEFEAFKGAEDVPKFAQ